MTATELPLLQTCCAPLLEGPLAVEDARQLASAFKALADPGRLRLLSLIAAQPGGEACNCDLVQPLGLSQPTVSHHLRLLHEAGLVSRERRGQWAYYRVLPERLAALRTALAVPVTATPSPSPVSTSAAF